MKHLEKDYVPKGRLEGFPLEVIDRMLEHQYDQKGIVDVGVFEKNIDSVGRGFYWDGTTEGFDFWRDVINFKKFDLFFERYPKTDKWYIRGSKEFSEWLSKQSNIPGGWEGNSHNIGYYIVKDRWDNNCIADLKEYREITLSEYLGMSGKVTYQIKPSFLSAVKSILPHTTTFKNNSKEYDTFKELGVLDLWFEVVLEFKVGDYVMYEDCFGVIEDIDCNHYHLHLGDRTFVTKNIRHATPQEIEENTKLPRLDGYAGEIEGDYIVYGCQRMHKSVLDCDIDSITVKGIEIDNDMLNKIRNVLKFKS